MSEEAVETPTKEICKNLSNTDIKSPVKQIETSPEKTEQLSDIEKLKKEANLKYLQGKRDYVIRDYTSAVASLADACQLLGQIYGEQADELGDAYFYYAKALFEVARSESGVLGDQVEQDDNDDEDDDEENEEEPEEVNKEEDNKEEPPQNGEKKEDEAGEESEDVNDLQLSWELFELTKVIYQRKADECKETAIKLSEVYLCLGENALESESYSTAIEDINSCLELQKKLLPAEDRRIAETYYQLGVAHSLDKNFDEAVVNFQSAVDQLQLKIKSLESRKAEGGEKTEEESKDLFYTMDGEIKEIQSLIVEIKEKITDMEDYKKQMKEEIVKQVSGYVQLQPAK